MQRGQFLISLGKRRGTTCHSVKERKKEGIIPRRFIEQVQAQFRPRSVSGNKVAIYICLGPETVDTRLLLTLNCPARLIILPLQKHQFNSDTVKGRRHAGCRHTADQFRRIRYQSGLNEFFEAQPDQVCRIFRSLRNNRRRQ